MPIYFSGPPGPEFGGPPPHPPPGEQPASQIEGQPGGPDDSKANGRPLSQTKRAEQNRKAQRAFRERRDQHVKALESRSQLLDAALASADEANRRWEECRALNDRLRDDITHLREENTHLRQQLDEVYSQIPQGLLSHLMPSQPQQQPPTQAQPQPATAEAEKKDDTASKE